VLSPSPVRRPSGRTAAALLTLGALAATQATAVAAADAPAGSAASSVRHAGAGHLDPGLGTVGDQLEQVLVTAQGGVDAAARAVRAAGGRVTGALPLVDGVAAAVPAARLAGLSTSPGVLAVTADRQASFEAARYEPGSSSSTFAQSSEADAAWSGGNAGRGVGIAVLDTGVSEVEDFDGRLVHGPDLSGEGSTVDTFGHGTVMAGVAAGSGAASAGTADAPRTGVAPQATVVAVKVAGRDGAVDVSTILQGMHWVSAYREQYNIRVLNLSWGTDSTQDPAVDPLNHAVQRLWQEGIVVVVAAGNDGPRAGTVAKPADDPMVLSVGAYDDKGDANERNDVLAPWSSRGPTAAGTAKPELVAPGRTLVAVRSPGSAVEQENPKALVAPAYVKGSGTSQAAAVVSGLAALVVAARPELTPDQVKRVLTRSAAPLTSGQPGARSSGRARLAAALTADPGPPSWQVPTASGLGSLEASRGRSRVEVVCPGATAPTVLTGELDARCETWEGSRWTGSRWTGDAWTGSRWTEEAWSGSRWTGSRWTGGTWTGGSWSGDAWTGSRWTGSRWTADAWTGSRWTGSRWTGSRWTGSRWTSVDDRRSRFLTAFWGHHPPAGVTLPGETSDAP
jgi:serine protease AprX